MAFDSGMVIVHAHPGRMDLRALASRMPDALAFTELCHRVRRPAGPREEEHTVKYMLLIYNRLGFVEELAEAYREAARRTTSLPERRYLESRAARLGGGDDEDARRSRCEPALRAARPRVIQ